MGQGTTLRSREAVELGFILKQVKDYEFSMARFGDRLKLQKTVYLLQAFGVYLGYDFSWYLRGPYCTILATNGFLLQDIYAHMPYQDFKFDDKKSQKMFKKFLKFVKGKSTDDLEIATSLHYLIQTCEVPDDEAKSDVKDKQERFSARQVGKIWSEMRKCGLISKR